MKTAKSISHYRFSHPQNNLPRAAEKSEPEAAFTKAFTETYLAKASAIHAGSGKTHMLLAREIPVHGLGIADLLSVAWRPSPENAKQDWISVSDLVTRRPTVRAFEAKLGNWKKGLMQAHRYGYFSDASILVFPLSKIPAVLKHLETFQKLLVGLWGFDEETRTIRAFFTPRPNRPSIAEHREIAIQRVLDSSRSLLEA